jgi:hypothetical protein
MSEITYHVALPFVSADDGFAPGDAVECLNPKCGDYESRSARAQTGLRRSYRVHPER